MSKNIKSLIVPFSEIVDYNELMIHLELEIEEILLIPEKSEYVKGRLASYRYIKKYLRGIKILASELENEQRKRISSFDDRP